MESNKYWLSKLGGEYAYQQQQRSIRGNKSYGQQEYWLIEHLRQIAQVKNKKLRVLDFGCGFGRFARILSEFDFIDYYGYDFSASMIAPLLENPPEKLGDKLADRVRVRPTLREAYPHERFDIVFTVSVLIHNPEDLAKRLLGDMLSVLDEGGQVCLVENKLCSMTVKDNDWHDGCWLHSFASYLPDFHQITALRNISDDHDIYLISRCQNDGVSYFINEGADSPVVPFSRGDYFRLGEARLALSIQNNEMRSQRDLVGGYGHDLEEKLGYAIETLKSEQDENKKLRERISLVDSVHRWLRDIQIKPDLTPCVTHEEVSKIPGPAIKYLWNGIQDCRFAHRFPGFDRVCHIFHLEWFGIRAAAGSLPGSKLGISATANWNAGELLAIGEQLSSSNISVLVIHGMSPAMRHLIDVLRRAGSFDVYLVWHGNTAQWINRDELELVSMILEMNRQGAFRRVHAIRTGMENLFGANVFVPQLLNMPPLVTAALSVGLKRAGASVLCPSWNDLRKNLYSNLLAATQSDRVEKIYAFAANLAFPAGMEHKVQVLPHQSQAETIDLMSMVDLVSNVTVIDCHPMVNLEALAVGTPTLEGPLFLDALEDHPYKQLVRVDNPLSVSDIRKTMESVLSAPEVSLNQMMEDYRLQLTELSRQRYLDFLGASL